MESIGLPFGDGADVIGVSNCRKYRTVANLLYYERFRKSLPPYPWPFRKSSTRGMLS